MGTEASPAPNAGPLGYGMAPVAAAGAVTLLCAIALLIGGPGAVADALASTAPPQEKHSSSSPAGGNEGKPDDGTGTSTAGPTAPPERGSAPEPAQPADTVRYLVWGDTLSQISLETGVSVQRLAEYNSIPNADLIYADEMLTIPYILIPNDAAAPTH